MHFQVFSFSTADSKGKRLKTSTFNELSLLLSKGSLLWVPSVLLLPSSVEEKKYGNSFSAHLCCSCSFCSISFTAKNFRGVTHERTTSSSIAVSKDCCSWGISTIADIKGGTVTGVLGIVTAVEDCAVTVSGMDGDKGVDGGSGTKSPKLSVRLAKAAGSMVQRSSFSWNWKLKTSLVNLGSTLSTLDKKAHCKTCFDGTTRLRKYQLTQDDR